MTHNNTNAPSHADLAEDLKEHVWYEVFNLVAQYQLLRMPEVYRAVLNEKVAEVIEDALIVSFCTHARNLLEFFWRTDSRRYGYALAINYAKPGYEPLKFEEECAGTRHLTRPGQLYGQLCAQVNHLTHERTGDSEKKIGLEERDELVGIIHGEVERLVRNHLKPAFKQGYFGLQLLADAKRDSTMIQVGQVAGPSNALGFVMTNLLAGQATHTTTPQLATSIGPALFLKPQQPNGPVGPTAPEGPYTPAGPTGPTGPAKPTV